VKDKSPLRLQVFPAAGQGSNLVLGRPAMGEAVEGAKNEGVSARHLEVPHVGDDGPDLNIVEERFLAEEGDHPSARVQAVRVEAGFPEAEQDPARSAAQFKDRALRPAGGLEPIGEVEIQSLEEKVV